MTTTASNPLMTIDSILAGADELAVLPQVAMRLIDLTVDPKATATDVERIVGTDPALAGRVLSLANSSYYGLPRQISSLREAVVFLGFKTIRNMAMAVSTFNLFLGKSDTNSLARRELWRHAMDTGQAARMLTTMLHPSDREAFGSDEAFTCGLLHDIGKLALDSSRHALFVTITDTARARGLRFYEVEAQALPWSHAQIGMTLAARWNLPRAICETIGFHHTPRAAMANPRLTATVALANELAHYLADSREAQDAPDKAAERWPLLLAHSEEMMQVLRLTPERVQAIAATCRLEVEKGLSAHLTA